MAYTEVMGLEGTNAVNNDLLTTRSRAEFLGFSSEIRPDMLDLINNSKLRLSDARIVSLKPVDGKTIHMFDTADPKKRGVCSLTSAKLDKNRVLLASAISLTAAITYKEGATRADDISMGIKATYRPIDELFKTTNLVAINANKEVFVLPEGSTVAENAAALGLTTAVVAALVAAGSIVTEDTDSLFAGLESGDCTFKCDSRYLLKELPLTVFKKNPNSHLPKGQYKLDNPRLLQDDVPIEFDVELAAEVDHDGNESCVWLRLEIIGTGTIA